MRMKKSFINCVVVSKTWNLLWYFEVFDILNILDFLIISFFGQIYKSKYLTIKKFKISFTLQHHTIFGRIKLYCKFKYHVWRRKHSAYGYYCKIQYGLMELYVHQPYWNYNATYQMKPNRGYNWSLLVSPAVVILMGFFWVKW